MQVNPDYYYDDEYQATFSILKAQHENIGKLIKYVSFYKQ